MKYVNSLLFLLIGLLFLGNVSYGQSQPKITLEEHIELLAPKLLDHYNVAGIGIMVLEESNIAYTKMFGYADLASKAPIKPSTIFNIGSISKPMTAWGVMHLVEQGKINLDEPVNRYLKSVKLQSDSMNTNEVTIRQLLSHTAGLSLAAVPEYSPNTKNPDLTTYLKESKDLYFLQEPGTGWNYSGGGYMVLQQVIEDITGDKFGHFMEKEILEPLDMENSSYSWRPDLVKYAATPYHENQSTEYFIYTGQAAASLNTNLDDLGKWMEATFSLVNNQHIQSEILDPATFHLMINPAPAAQRQYGLSYGLGYELWPMGNNTYLAGHNGQNTGWTSGAWFNPSTGDGLVVLINDSYGYNTWRGVFCDWMYWTSEIKWRGICTDRPGELPVLNTYRGEVKQD